MTKALKKICLIYLSIIVILATFSRVFATDVVTNLNVIQETSETLYLENDQGFISKKIVDSNKDTGEVTIELKLSNTKKDTEKIENDSTEIIFVIDNSFSMEEKVSENKTRRDAVISSAQEFTSSLFKDVNNLKVGLVYYYGFDTTDDGNSVQSYGTVDTAKVLVSLTDDEPKVQKGLSSLSTMNYNSGTNTDAGIRRAKSMFTSSTTSQKFIILLSDGVPNHAVDVSIRTGGWFYPSATEHQASVKNTTRSTIQSLGKSNINLITMLSGLTELSEDDKNVIEAVFGTAEKPTLGKLYNINDAEIDKIIKEEIYHEVLEKVQNPINTVKIVDYFPEDIADNFEFSYVGNASIGDVTEDIDPGDHTIEWNIDTLKGDEVATLRYKLKIKDMNNAELLNKTIATNEKVVLTYKDTDSKDYTVTLNSSPKIQLSEIKQEENNTSGENNSGIDYGGISTNNEKDITQASGKLPQTGIGVGIVIAIASIIGIGIFSYSRIREYKDI